MSETSQSLMFGYVCQEDIAAIFGKADKGETGTLNKKEFKGVVKDICQRYPQVELYLKKKKLRNIANLLKSANGDNTELSIETFKQALSEVDTQMKNLPATAQVKLLLLDTVLYSNVVSLVLNLDDINRLHHNKGSTLQSASTKWRNVRRSQRDH